jgi:hypothetical protein
MESDEKLSNKLVPFMILRDLAGPSKRNALRCFASVTSQELQDMRNASACFPEALIY